MISEKIPHKGEDYILNYTEVIVEVPNDSITEVIIPDKQCYALAGDLACCMDEQGNYEPYSHQFLRGWEKHTSNSSTLISEICNPDTAIHQSSHHYHYPKQEGHQHQSEPLPKHYLLVSQPQTRRQIHHQLLQAS